MGRGHGVRVWRLCSFILGSVSVGVGLEGWCGEFGEVVL